MDSNEAYRQYLQRIQQIRATNSVQNPLNQAFLMNQQTAASDLRTITKSFNTARNDLRLCMDSADLIKARNNGNTTLNE